jgi:hypothetical protein
MALIIDFLDGKKVSKPLHVLNLLSVLKSSRNWLSYILSLALFTRMLFPVRQHGLAGDLLELSYCRNAEEFPAGRTNAQLVLLLFPRVTTSSKG